MKKSEKVLSDLRISNIENLRAKFSEDVYSMSPYEYILLVRKYLGMTQAQLGARCGLSQQYVADIESGKKDVRLSTLKKIFKAMNCQFLSLPLPHVPFEKMIQDRAEKIAKNNLRSVLGTMAMEEQLPKTLAQRVMLKNEIRRLSERLSSELWDE